MATLRYSPPELLYRDEEDSVDGWRAVSFYQLGAVLHDMIMQYPLFHEYGDPYARLVDAVRAEVPQIAASDVEPRMIFLAKRCLVKDPKQRLPLVSWNDFLCAPSSEEKSEVLRDRIVKKIGIVKGNKTGNEEDAKRAVDHKRLLQFEGIIDSIKEMMRGICVSDMDCFPPFETVKAQRTSLTKGAITICFGPSGRHALGVALTLAIVVTQLSGEPETTIELGSIAVASRECLTDISGSEIQPGLFFKGPYDRAFVQEKVQELLLSVLDKGQELSPADLSGARAGKLEDVVAMSL